jgi:hypothetical protein
MIKVVAMEKFSFGDFRGPRRRKGSSLSSIPFTEFN